MTETKEVSPSFKPGSKFFDSRSGMLVVKYRYIYEILKKQGHLNDPNNMSNRNLICKTIRNSMKYDFVETDLLRKIRVVCNNMSTRWKGVSQSSEKFENKYNLWLENSFTLPTTLSRTRRTSCSSTTSTSSLTSSKGRPKISSFASCSAQTKRRRVSDDIQNNPEKEVLLAAAKTVLHKNEQRSAAQLVPIAAESTKESAREMCRILKSKKEQVVPYTADEALAYFLDARHTKHSYLETRLGAKERKADIYPSYQRIREAKNRCYPDPENIHINEKGVCIDLQEILNLTIQRLFMTIDKEKISEDICNLELYCKWGCDGSSGHSEFMHDEGLHEVNENQIEDSDEENVKISDRYLFLVSFVPLRVTGVRKNNESVILWSNKKPSSTWLCRPVKLLYKKETQNVIKKEVSKVEEEIRNLQPFPLNVDSKSKTLPVKYSLVMTMIDGKVVNALTNTSSQCCNICGCKPSDFNNLNTLGRKYPVREENLQFSLSPLHTTIKFMDLVLALSYHLELKAPTTRNAINKQRQRIEERKIEVRENLYKELKIKVDKVLPGGGTTNTGNVARRFFEDPSVMSKITGIDEALIMRFITIIEVITANEEIDVEKFEQYTMETARKYVELYYWHRMPPTIHRVLLHGAQIARHHLVPIGALSEEAQEARNKDYNRFREFHSRKSDRRRTSEDVIHILLASSDPWISSLRRQTAIHKKNISEVALSLLVNKHEEQKVVDLDDTEDMSTTDGSG